MVMLGASRAGLDAALAQSRPVPRDMAKSAGLCVARRRICAACPSSSLLKVSRFRPYQSPLPECRLALNRAPINPRDHPTRRRPALGRSANIARAIQIAADVPGTDVREGPCSSSRPGFGAFERHTLLLKCNFCGGKISNLHRVP